VCCYQISYRFSAQSTIVLRTEQRSSGHKDETGNVFAYRKVKSRFGLYTYSFWFSPRQPRQIEQLICNSRKATILKKSASLYRRTEIYPCCRGKLLRLGDKTHSSGSRMRRRSKWQAPYKALERQLAEWIKATWFRPRCRC